MDNPESPAAPPEPADDEGSPDPLDVEAANIDARSTTATEQIEELIEHADELGRDPTQDVDSDIPER
jgi:hypothetical protein